MPRSSCIQLSVIPLNSQWPKKSSAGLLYYAVVTRVHGFCEGHRRSCREQTVHSCGWLWRSYWRNIWAVVKLWPAAAWTFNRTSKQISRYANRVPRNHAVTKNKIKKKNPSVSFLFATWTDLHGIRNDVTPRSRVRRESLVKKFLRILWNPEVSDSNPFSFLIPSRIKPFQAVLSHFLTMISVPSPHQSFGLLAGFFPSVSPTKNIQGVSRL